MDIELLIDKVYERPPLWDRKNKLHSKRNVVDSLWAEVCKEIGYEEVLVKRKWKYLRDQYAVELGKFPQNGSGEDGVEAPGSKWAYFEALQFLNGIVKPRTTTRSSSRVISTTEASLDSEEGILASLSNAQEAIVLKDEPIEKRLIASYYPKKSTVKRIRQEEYNNSIYEAENQNQYYIEKSTDKQDDEDVMFFKSLLPHVRRIPDANKLIFRNRMQELVQEFAYQEQDTGHSNDSSPGHA